MHKNVRSRHQKYQAIVGGTKNAIVLTSKDLSGVKSQFVRELAIKNKFKLTLFIKRYFHKLFVSQTRKSNEKVSFNGNMLFLTPLEGANFGILPRVKRLGFKVEGVISDNSFDTQYGLYVASKFENGRAAILMLKQLIMVLFKSIKNLEKIQK